MNRLLEILQDGRFHSGRELGQALGVSRSAIWKHLKRLEEQLGISLYRIPGRGYRLAEPVSLLDEKSQQSNLHALGWRAHLLRVTDSTNAEALRRLMEGEQAPFVIIAEEQTAGRGRRGRSWLSPPAQNLYYTLALRVTGGPKRLSGLSLVVGLAVMRALREMGVPHAGVKWPNDIYVDERKVAGILLELTGDPADVCHVVIGIGINVNMTSLDAEAIDRPWTSLRLERSEPVDRNALVKVLSLSLDDYLRRHREQGFAGLRAEWESHNVWQSKRCCLNTGNELICGDVLGVDDEGALRLLVDGRERRFSGGELSLRLAHDS